MEGDSTPPAKLSSLNSVGCYCVNASGVRVGLERVHPGLEVFVEEPAAFSQELTDARAGHRYPGVRPGYGDCTVALTQQWNELSIVSKRDAPSGKTGGLAEGDLRGLWVGSQVSG